MVSRLLIALVLASSAVAVAGCTSETEAERVNAHETGMMRILCREGGVFAASSGRSRG